MARRIGERIFLKDCDVRVINNGLDLSVFAPKQSDCKARYGLEHKKLLLSVANVWTEKGWNDLIRLSGMLSDEYRMVIVGLNEKQKASLPENITGILHTESLDELVELYSSADFLLNPTYGDTFPTVNIEALACGTPVITYNTGGSPEILDETCGAVIPCGDVNAFSEALKKDYSRENCKERAKRYSKVTSAENYLRLYREILKLSE